MKQIERLEITQRFLHSKFHKYLFQESVSYLLKLWFPYPSHPHQLLDQLKARLHLPKEDKHYVG